MESLFGDNRTIAIAKGDVQIHNNPRLCYKYIKQFFDSVGKEVDTGDVLARSNGNKALCEEVAIRLSILNQVSQSHFLVITWDGYNIWTDPEANDTLFGDHRMSLGYQVYYKKVDGPNANVEITTTRDHCSDELVPALLFAC